MSKDNKALMRALKATETMDGISISGNNFKITQFLSLREHLVDLLENKKPPVDDLKRRMAEEIIRLNEAHNIIYKHDIFDEVIRYIEGLEAE